MFNQDTSKYSEQVSARNIGNRHIASRNTALATAWDQSMAEAAFAGRVPLGSLKYTDGSMSQTEYDVVLGKDTSLPRAAAKLDRPAAPPCCTPGARGSLSDWDAPAAPQASSEKLSWGVAADSCIARESPIQRPVGKAPTSEWRPPPIIEPGRGAVDSRARLYGESMWENTRSRGEERK